MSAAKYICNPLCDFCSKDLSGLHGPQRSAHRRWCDANPNRGQKAAPRSVVQANGKRSWYATLSACKHCAMPTAGLSASQRANHMRWCLQNPARDDHVKGSAWQLRTPAATAKRGEKIKEAHARGAYKGSAQKGLANRIKNGKLKPTEKALENMRRAAQAATHQRVCKSTHEFIDKRGRVFKFDSKWEDAVAARLDELDIEWARPNPIAYSIGGTKKLYYPDFYLPAFDLYLDPKNSYCQEVQRPKIEAVSKIITLAILRTLDECKTFDPRDANWRSAAECENQSRVRLVE